MFQILCALAAAAAVSTVSGCASNEVDLASDAFVGEWQCGETKLVMTAKTVELDGKTQKIAWIETGKNVDYGLFMTDGGHYSVYDTTRTSLNFHDHKGERSFGCTAS